MGTAAGIDRRATEEITDRQRAGHIDLGAREARATEARKSFDLRRTPKRLFSSVVAPGATPR